jgi:hypothetical protein
MRGIVAEGGQEERGQVPPAASVVTPSAPPLYFAVSTSKFVLMSLCTLGLYVTYWFYQNWALIKAREQSAISPVWRSLFEFLFCYSCLARIRATAREHQVEVTLPAGPLTTGFILAGLLGSAPAPCWQLSSLAVFFLVPAQTAVNRLNTTLAPGHEENRSFSALNLATMLVGGGLTLTSLLLTFFPVR